MSRGLKRLAVFGFGATIAALGLIGWFSSPEGSTFVEQQVASAPEGQAQWLEAEPTPAYWETFQGQVCTMITPERPTASRAWAVISDLVDETKLIEHRFAQGGMELWSELEDDVQPKDVICGERKY